MVHAGHIYMQVGHHDSLTHDSDMFKNLSLSHTYTHTEICCNKHTLTLIIPYFKEVRISKLSLLCDRCPTFSTNILIKYGHESCFPSLQELSEQYGKLYDCWLVNIFKYPMKFVENHIFLYVHLYHYVS
jgi:hypothetical protein